MAWVPVVVAFAVTTLSNALATAGDALLARFAMFVVAAAAAVGCHIAGHLLAEIEEARIQPARWWPGIVLALVSIPLQLATGPYPAERVARPGRAATPEIAWRVTIAGPVSNLVCAGLAYALYVANPVPFLRLLAEVQLAVAAYSLMPFEPLDGSRLAKRRPLVLTLLGVILTIASAALAAGIA
jgi:hypothetical protein